MENSDKAILILREGYKNTLFNWTDRFTNLYAHKFKTTRHRQKGKTLLFKRVQSIRFMARRMASNQQEQ